jgi:epoxyqueuosine reductase
MNELKTIIKNYAKRGGFSIAGITTPEPLVSDAVRLKKWLEMGFHADMTYMEKNFEKRVNPSFHIDSAKSVILFGTNYFNSVSRGSIILNGISMYARGLDYHILLMKKIRELIDEVKKETQANFNAKLFVDSSPVLERALAKRAGLGWFGKNSCLINKNLGSYFFISGIIIDIELEPDKPFNDNYCGKCTECIESCPTGAIVSSGVVDSRLCISYHTIENKKGIPEFVRKRLNGWIFGCDICQQVCPWNRKVKETVIAEFKPSEELQKLNIQDLLKMNRAQFNETFRKSPLKRAGYETFMNNLKSALTT